LYVIFDLGVGSDFHNTAGQWNATNDYATTASVKLMATGSATWDITGVQLEPGSVRTEFERESYSVQLAKCQRYYFKSQALGTNDLFTNGFAYNTTLAIGVLPFPVQMRTNPTVIEQTGTATHYQVSIPSGAVVCSAVPAINNGTPYSVSVGFTVASGLTAGHGIALRSANASAYIAASAEL
jgi:hypothetical protein